MVAKSKILARSSLLRISFFFTNVLIAFVLMPFIIQSLGNQMYGLWVIVGSLLGYYWLIDFGISTAVARFISRAAGSKDYSEINTIVNTALFVYAIGGVISLVVSLTTAFFLPLFIHNISNIEAFRVVLSILGVSFAINFPMRIFPGILRAFLRYDLTTVVNFVVLILRTFLILFFLKRGHGIVALAGITLFTDIINRTCLYFLARKIYPQLKFSKRLVDKSKIRELFNYGGYAFLSQISMQMKFNIDNLIILIFLGLSSVTMYSIASRLITYFRKFIAASLGMMMPLFSQYEGQGDFKAIKEKFIFLTKISSYTSLFIGTVFLIFGKYFIQRWMGKEYIAAYTILVILTVASTFRLMQWQILELLRGISKHKFYALVDAGEGVANLILSIILVKKMGLIGVAWGTAIPMIFNQIFIFPAYACPIIGLSIKNYYFECILGVMMRSCLAVGIPFLLYRNFIRPEYGNICMLVSAQAFFYACLIFLIGFNRGENKMLRSLIASFNKSFIRKRPV